jgi:hypothetical protein
VAATARHHDALRHLLVRALELIEPELLPLGDLARVLLERLRARPGLLPQVLAATGRGHELQQRLAAGLGLATREVDLALLRLQTLLAAATGARMALLGVQLQARRR